MITGGISSVCRTDMVCLYYVIFIISYINSNIIFIYIYFLFNFYMSVYGDDILDKFD